MIITILSFILVIGVLVFFHELGHFMAAKSVGVRVEKFYLGFNFFGLGWEKEYKGTIYGIGLFPLGGYVKVAGVIDESMDTEFSGASDEFRSKNTLQQIWIMSAGVIMNFLLAIIIFSYLTYYNGINHPDPRAIIGQIIPEYPAEVFGLKEGDEILSINNIPVSNWKEMTDEIHGKPNEKIQLNWLRDEKTMQGSITTISIKQLEDDTIKEQGMLGISPILYHEEVSINGAILQGTKQTYQFLDLMIRHIKGLMKGNISIKELGGPIMIAQIAGETASAGANALLGLMAFLSVNLGLLNILPIPGLDGGHVLIAIIEGVIRRDLPIKVRLGIQQAGLFL